MSAALTRLPETGFLRQPQVLTLVPISKATLWRRVTAGTFPAPLKLSARVTVWRVEDVRRWIQEQCSQQVALIARDGDELVTCQRRS
jgi:predicted DNA-binding transcriptional regulator AlpA